MTDRPVTIVNPAFAMQVKKIRAALDTLDYFQLLTLRQDATFDDIRAGYHQQSRKFHPDRYHHMGNDELIEDLTAISKRITEAYVTLRDDTKRSHYLENIQGPKREASLRFEESHEADRREQESSRDGATAQGRQMLAEATVAWERGDDEAALKAMKMAVVYEPDNDSFSDKLELMKAELGID